MAYEEDAVDELLRPSEMPRPRLRGSGSDHPTAFDADTSAASQSPSDGVSPGTNASPRRATLRRRISNGSSPSAAAAALSCDSTAHDACGVPKPRNAVLGVVCDNSARATTLAFGVR